MMRAFTKNAGKPIRLKCPLWVIKADMCTAIGHVRCTPESDIKCDIWNVR